MALMEKDKSLAVVGIAFGAVFSLAMTMVATVQPLYLPLPPRAVGYLFWFGVTALLCCVASLAMLIVHWKRPKEVLARRQIVGPIVLPGGMTARPNLIRASQSRQIVRMAV
jgi:hypothetical protein